MKHWGSYPFSKHKAETEYHFSVPRGHGILIDGGFATRSSKMHSRDYLIMAEGRLQSQWGQSSLLDGILSLPPPRGTLSKSPDVVRCSPQHAGLDFTSVQFALFDSEVHSVIGSVSLRFLSGLLQGRHLPCSPRPLLHGHSFPEVSTPCTLPKRIWDGRAVPPHSVRVYSHLCSHF